MAAHGMVLLMTGSRRVGASRLCAGLAGALVLGGSLLGFGGCEGETDPAKAVTGSAQAARQSQVLRELKSVADALTADYLTSNEWPTVDQARSGALQGMTDPWDEPYQYEPPSARGENPKLYSKGRDRQAGTDDDIVFDAWQNLGG